MGTISMVSDTWVQVHNERAAKEGYVLWVKPGKYGQLHYLTHNLAPSPGEGTGGFYNLDLLFYVKGLECSPPDHK